jgi:CRP-like cAMP-binding protein
MPRTATIVAAEETNFATISREQFNKLLSTYYEYIQQQNLQFL